jgi:hypothetical protein
MFCPFLCQLARLDLMARHTKRLEIRQIVRAAAHASLAVMHLDQISGKQVVVTERTVEV